MPEDILSELRAREEEMEELINEARRQAARIREEASRSARELKESKLREAEEEARGIESSGRAAIEREAMGVEEEGRREAEALRLKGEGNRDRAVAEVVRFLAGTGAGK